jgi:hypothetical protein
LREVAVNFLLVACSSPARVREGLVAVDQHHGINDEIGHRPPVSQDGIIQHEEAPIMRVASVAVTVVGLCVACVAEAAVGQDVSTNASSSNAQSIRNPLADTNAFPIAVWLQDPRQAERYQRAGVNLYVGLWRGPTDSQLKVLKEAGMPVICSQNRVGLAHKDDPTIVAWMHGDEPDNAQPVVDRETGRRSWGPCIPPARIVADYRKIKEKDPSRPVMLNLGQGVANDEWKGRGPGASLDDYPGYVQGSDIVSFDVYPVAGLDRPDAAERLWYVAKGVDRLMEWTGGKKRVWNCIECTHISNPEAKATPHQVKAEVWMSLVHGSTGLIYFVHQFRPSFNEHALLDDPEMLAAVTAMNRQIQELAPILNSPSIKGKVRVKSSSPTVPIDVMVKHRGEITYVFSVSMRNSPTRGAFEVDDLPENAIAEVLGEGGRSARTIAVKKGRFQDEFSPFDVHLYAIRAARP